MIMTKKNKRVVITVLAVCCVIISVWTIMRYIARRELVEQFNSDLAQLDAIANRANANEELRYSDAFSVLWEQYLKSPAAKKGFNMIGEYEYLKLSPVYQMLTNSGDKRQEEADALQKMSIAGEMLKEPYFLGYDSLMSVSKTARQYIVDGLKVMEPYRSEQTDIQGWREITPQKYFKLFEKYNQE